MSQRAQSGKNGQEIMQYILSSAYIPGSDTGIMDQTVPETIDNTDGIMSVGQPITLTPDNPDLLRETLRGMGLPVAAQRIVHGCLADRDGRATRQVLAMLLGDLQERISVLHYNAQDTCPPRSGDRFRDTRRQMQEA